MPFFDAQYAFSKLSIVLSGLHNTIGIAVASFIFGIIIGFFVALMRLSRSKWFSIPARMYVSFLRGVPMLVLLFFTYYGLPYLKIVIPPQACAVLCFSIASSAYVSEIIRAAVRSIDHGQWEAASSLGLNYALVMKKVIAPQAFRRAIPPLSNVMIDILKGTSLVGTITIADIFQKSQTAAGDAYDFMSMYILIALIYWSICFLLERLQDFLERKFVVSH